MNFPDLYAAAEQVSARNQKTFLVSRAAEYVSFVLAALFAAVPAEGNPRIFPLLAVASFVVALVVRVSGVGDKAEKRWYDARAAAESVKSASWQFAVCGEAFRASDSEASGRFVSALQAVLQTLPDLDVPASADGHGAATREMQDLRDASLEARSRAYRTRRVADQVRWYAEKAKWNRGRARMWRAALIVVEIAAVTLGMTRVFGWMDIDWLGVFAAAASGVAAWQQTKSYAALSEAYSVTSHEVKLVASSFQGIASEEDWAQAVHDAEAAFSREHTLWLARRQAPR